MAKKAQKFPKEIFVTVDSSEPDSSYLLADYNAEDSLAVNPKAVATYTLKSVRIGRLTPTFDD